MIDPLFETIDAYIDSLFAVEDAALAAASDNMKAAGLPPIQVSPGQGKFLYLMARLAGARRILEIGTLGGYSTIWLARALPADGSLVSLEYSPDYADVARRNLAGAGLDGIAEVRVGAALDTLPDLAEDGRAPFDLIFLDADKVNFPAYLAWSLKLGRPGGLIVADNVIRAGAVMDAASSDPSAVGAAEFNRRLAAEPRVEAIVLQQVGIKGHDGLAVARIRD